MQVEILRLMALGYNNDDIARERGITRSSVERSMQDHCAMQDNRLPIFLCCPSPQTCASVVTPQVTVMVMVLPVTGTPLTR